MSTFEKHQLHVRLFQRELANVQHAKEIAEQWGQQDHPLTAAFEQLIRDYEDLLADTAKVFRISDLQTRMLKEREQEIAEANDKLNQLGSARRRLISDLSHEMNTPMQSIIGYTRAMLDGLLFPSTEYLSLIYDKSVFVSKLIDDLFELTNLEDGQLPLYIKEVDAYLLFTTLTDKYRLDVESKKRPFTSQFSPLLPQGVHLLLHIDPVRIEQVLANLVNNAVKHTPAGTPLHLEGTWEVLALEADSMRMSTSDPEQRRAARFTLSLQDKGEGIDSNDLPHLFERFYRSPKNASSRGTGLGLAIAKEIVVKHKGEMSVSSQVGRGTTFSFALPATWIRAAR